MCNSALPASVRVLEGEKKRKLRSRIELRELLTLTPSRATEYYAHIKILSTLHHQILFNEILFIHTSKITSSNLSSFFFHLKLFKICQAYLIFSC